MEAVLLPGERNDLVSTNRLAHGWAYQEMANYLYSILITNPYKHYKIYIERVARLYGLNLKFSSENFSSLLLRFDFLSDRKSNVILMYLNYLFLLLEFI